MTTYNGHKNWNHWNVSLWINNDEGLYRLALDCIKDTANRAEAAERFINHMNEFGQDKTPNGALYTKSSVMAAMRGM